MMVKPAYIGIDTPGGRGQAMNTNALAYSPDSIARVLSLDDSAVEFWDPRDYPQLVRHQLDSPLAQELAGIYPAKRAEIEQAVYDGPVRCLADLLRHAQPPVKLLELERQLFKAQTGHHPALLPPEVAFAFYYALSAVGMMRLGRWFSRLDDAGLRHGLQWALSQAWIDDQLRDIFQEGLCYLDRVAAVGGTDSQV
jgi:hypothetical protein